MKTAMQLYVNWLKKQLSECKPLSPNIPFICIAINKAELLLELEKEQMKIIYDGVKQNVGTCIKESHLPTFSEYYNHTYNNTTNK